jgi:hypothetical protein
MRNCNAHHKGVKSEFEQEILNLDPLDAASDFEPAEQETNTSATAPFNISTHF